MTRRSMRALFVAAAGPRVLGAACVLAAAFVLGAAGCGGGSGGSGSTHGSGSASAAGASTPSGPGSVPSDAQSAATGDIPDSQVFLTFVNAAAGYSIRYPEGWTQSAAAGAVAFADHANVIRVSVASGPAPTLANTAAGVARLKLSDPTVKAGSPERLTVNGAPVLKITYTRLSTADPVTGKRLPLTIDRYEYTHAGKTAIVDLGTAKGVDNVDAYRMISRSFRWR